VHHQLFYDNSGDHALDYIFSDGKPRRSGYSTGAEDGTSSSSITQP
jgi:hypothetical protein